MIYPNLLCPQDIYITVLNFFQRNMSQLKWIPISFHSVYFSIHRDAIGPIPFDEHKPISCAYIRSLWLNPAYYSDWQRRRPVDGWIQQWWCYCIGLPKLLSPFLPYGICKSTNQLIPMSDLRGGSNWSYSNLNPYTLEEGKACPLQGV